MMPCFTFPGRLTLPRAGYLRNTGNRPIMISGNWAICEPIHQERRSVVGQDHGSIDAARQEQATDLHQEEVQSNLLHRDGHDELVHALHGGL